MFDDSQPDWNWRNETVREEFLDILKYWFDLGVDGFRIDVAHGNAKPINYDSPDLDGGAMWNQPEVHQIYQSWRKLAAVYSPEKYFVGEVWLPPSQSASQYLQPGELDQLFAFDLMVQPWHGPSFKNAIVKVLESLGEHSLPAWALSNHDVHRTVTRYGQKQFLGVADSADMIAGARRLGEADLELGQKRALAATALVLALPGSYFLYQGEELGLPEVFDLPDWARQDPIWIRTQGTELGRDGCRVPLPWSEEGQSFGFSTKGREETWLPQPQWFKKYNCASQERDKQSSLNLYRDLIAKRKIYRRNARKLRWIETGNDSVLAFQSGKLCNITNFGDEKYSLKNHQNLGEQILNTGFVDCSDEVIANSTSWFACEE